MSVVETTFVLIKNHSIQRGLVGRILQIFEDTELTIDRAELLLPKKTHIENHYQEDTAWLTSIGKNTIRDFKLFNEDLVGTFGTTNTQDIGKTVYRWSKEQLAQGKVMAVALSGPHAITKVKQISGTTIPLESQRGTIRGDFCGESIVYANLNGRAVHNVVHRSANANEAEKEVSLWFS